MQEEVVKINSLETLENFLSGKEVTNEDYPFIYYNKNTKQFVFQEGSLRPYSKAPEITKSMYLTDVKLLESIHNRYIPIIDINTSENLFPIEEFNNMRKKMSGISSYNAGNYVFSDNLYFKGLDPYLNAIDANINLVNSYRDVVYKEIISKLEPLGLTISIGSNSGGNIELVEAGSTVRYTNIPSFDPSKKWDFDFTVRFDPENTWTIKNALENGFQVGRHITQTSRYKVRLADVVIPGLNNPIDLDFSLTPQRENYLSTEDALKERLDNMQHQDDSKYRLVLANVMYAKNMLKTYGAYKPSRGIIDGDDRRLGGLGGVGIENWVIQNGGSLIDATNEFLKYAEGRDFKEFEQVYSIVDFGANHVGKSKHIWPYDNFIVNNMRYLGYEKMKECLEKFQLELAENEKQDQTMQENVKRVLTRIENTKDFNLLRNLSIDERIYSLKNLDDYGLSFANNEEELITFLKSYFTSEEVKNILSGSIDTENNYLVYSVFLSMTDNDKIPYLNNEKFSNIIEEITNTMNPNFLLNYVNSLTDLNLKAKLIPYIKSDILKLQFLQNNNLNEETKLLIFKNFENKQYVIDNLNLLNDEDKVKIIMYYDLHTRLKAYAKI